MVYSRLGYSSLPETPFPLTAAFRHRAYNILLPSFLQKGQIGMTSWNQHYCSTWLMGSL